MQSAESTTSGGPSARYILQVYVGALSLHYEALSVEASKQTTAEEIVSCIVERLTLPTNKNYELAEVAGECKERRLSADEKPVSVMLLWPMHSELDFHRFYLRESQHDVPWLDSYGVDPQIFRDFIPFLIQPENREYPDLCQLPDLNESTLLENLRQRFEAGHIYTYVGSILIAVNPFKFHPIYNPKYVRLYQNQRVGPILPPHIFAIADNAYYCMLKEKRNQCVVISGESGSGKTESTNFLLHHLTALSQKGSHGSGVEQTILSAGPVLEAFGNAKTAHNNNSSRFGKFIQVNYRENGMVQGAVVQKYLLEKSRIVSQGAYERNYHVFYYLLSGATDQEREILHLLPAERYCYLNAKNLTLENCDEKYEFSRLKQSMEMVGFSAEKQRRLFNVLSAVLLLGNVEFFPKKSTYHHDESVQVRNLDVVGIISELLKVKQDTLLAALTSKRVKASGETLIMQYKLPEAIAARDALAKCLYGALFDWIVLQVNHALLNKDQTPHTGHSIGVLDIFGFEDFGSQNSFEQLCINYANEHLQYYFNLHVFKYEQNEYKKEGIQWRDIDFMDNSGCLQLFESKPTGLLCILDDLCNFPGATNETLLQKFNSVHKENSFYEKPQKKENAFIIKHYAGKVKYQVTEMREKNLDLMRQDIVSVLKNSSMAFVRELVGADPVAVFRWAIIRAFFRGYFAFRNAGIKHRKERNDQSLIKISGKTRIRPQNDSLLSKKIKTTTLNNDTTMTFTQQQAAQLNKSPRKSWSSIAYNNKNFPDGKLGYEHQSITSNLSSSPITTNTTTANKLFNKGYPKFERSGQDVMARASQIVQKNKSFRPRERPKKGLKNLQTVKTLTAGQNLSNQSTVKTRKQPLTVTAQFQNSLSALMDTLNQANPFFIRCIKSNPNKIPNKFDDATVIRQLRYTGMLETVRIRRAGYNVRLTYEEFIQLYRILLPKGLVSSQKDVRDFMNTMNLNKQHYQLGISKIYMRESEKMRLDIRLHTRIVDSIFMIQRWFRGLLLRRKYQTQRSSAIVIQSFWRMYWQQKQYNFKKLQHNAAILIQSKWRMFITRKYFNKIRIGVIIVQAHIRGKLARINFKKAYRQKILKERNKLRPTQSLPANERSIDLACEQEDLKRSINIPHHSFDSEITDHSSAAALMNRLSSLQSNQYFTATNKSTDNLTEHSSLLEQQRRDVLHKAENQFRSLMISSSNSSNNYNKESSSSSASTNLPQQQFHQYHHDYQNLMFPSFEQVDSKQSYDVSEQMKRNDVNKTPIRRVDSGPASDSKRRYDKTFNVYDINNFDVLASPPQHSGSFVPQLSDQNISRISTSSAIVAGGNQQQAITKQPSRRDLVCRSTGDDFNSNYQLPAHHNYQNVPFKTTTGNAAASLQQQQQQHSQQNVYLSQNNSQFQQNPNVRNTQKTTISTQQQQQQHVDDLSSKGNFATPKVTGKAAALLGTISEDIKHSKIDNIIGKSRRAVKSNLSDEFAGTVAVHHQILSRQHPVSSDSLKRRNSDPSTNKITLLDVNRGNDMYQSSTHINIAGHRFRKAGRIGKAEKCASCQESDAFVNEGHRCLDCKVLVHTKCIQNGGVKTLHCEAKRSKRLRKNIDKTATPNSKYSGTREYTDSTDKIISDAKELQLMQDFITQKICKMDNDCEKPSEVDRVFKQALREFKDNLVAQYSVAHKQNSDMLNIKYRDLIANFEQVMETCCGRKDDFPLTMGVNAFRGFLNEFMSSRETDKPKAKRKKEKKRKVDEHTNFNGHTFLLTIINIPTACEICQLFLLWPIERGLVCQNCRLTCHKKCYQKAHICNKVSNSSNNNTSYMTISDSTLFGVPLTALCLTDGCVKIPVKIEQLITKIEMHGLYAEGIYRKSGVNSKIKELKTKMSEFVSPELDYDSYNVHVLANVLKLFLREMPEPLLSFDRYDDFLRASELSETVERVSTLMSLIKKLPTAHHALLERLVFHLALVASREQYNRMSASSLAIVFAPCVLRTNRQIPAQDSLNDIGRQTKCIETLITQKMVNVRSLLNDIDTLDTAAHTATTRLSSLRSSKVFTPEEMPPRSQNIESETEEMILEDHIEEIKKEKAMLTSTLPSLARASSDDDLLSTDMDGEGGSLDDLSSDRDRDSHYTNESRDMKDSIDSSICSFGDNISRKTLDTSDATTLKDMSSSASDGIIMAATSDASDAAVAVSYNLREQNIDFIHPQTPRNRNIDRDAFIKNSFSVPKSSINSSLATSSPRLTVSHQNLSYSQKAGGSGLGSVVGSSGYISSASTDQQQQPLSRPKPLAVRSMSTYETSTTSMQSLMQSPPSSSSSSKISVINTTDPSLLLDGNNGGNNSSSSSSIKNSSNNSKDNKNNNRNNTKRQSSLDDEPIMV